ncbi:hypothetical protein ACNQ1O_00790 [Mycoplasma sp. B6188]|uniref:hypothetical protein n=1 Tax=Mycoplasma sp. B6188 TaxID=3401673 RepID=UPI003AAA79F8
MNKLKTIFLAMAGTTITLLPVAATVACKHENEDKKPAGNNAGGTTATPGTQEGGKTTPGTQEGGKTTPGTQEGGKTTPGTQEGGSSAGETKTSAIAEAAKKLALNIDNKYLNNAEYRAYLNASAYSLIYGKVGVTGMDTAKYDVKVKDFAIDDANGKVTFNVEATDKADKSQTVTKALELTGFRPTTAEELAKVNAKEVHITPVANVEDINYYFNSNPKYINYYFKDSVLNSKRDEKDVENPYYNLSEPIFEDKDSFQLCQADDVLFGKNNKRGKYNVNPSSRFALKAVDKAKKTITFAYRVAYVIKSSDKNIHQKYVISEPKEITVSFAAKETSAQPEAQPAA